MYIKQIEELEKINKFEGLSHFEVEAIMYEDSRLKDRTLDTFEFEGEFTIDYEVWY